MSFFRHLKDDSMSEQEPTPVRTSPGNIPIPDPSAVTTEVINRSISALREYLEGQLAIRDERINGIDKATALRLTEIIRIPTQIDEKTDQLRSLLEERLSSVEDAVAEKARSIQLQFSLAENQRVEQKADTKAAVEAALTSQKEAVREQTVASERSIAKSEAATAKQIEQLTANFQTAIGGVNVALSDQKERIGRIENLKQGGQQAYAGLYAALAGVATLIGIIAFLVARV